MSEWSCSDARERLPEHVTGRLEGSEAARVASHLETCAGCAAEADLLTALLGSRPEPPAGLAERIRGAVLEDRASRGVASADPRRRRPGVPRWSLVAAAALVLALGTGLFWHDLVPVGDGGPLARVALDPVPETWMDDDAVVAGAPVLDELNDDALLALLEEME